MNQSINNGIIINGKQQFEMTDSVMLDVEENLGQPRDIKVNAIGGARSDQAAARLINALTNKGFHVTFNKMGILSPPLDQPIEIRSGNVYVDATK